MRSLKATVAMTTVLVLLSLGASWASSYASAAVARGVDLSLGLRVAVGLSNWYVRLEPFLALGGIGLAAIVGAFCSRGTTLVQERWVLLCWLLGGVGALALEVLLPEPASVAAVRWWVHVVLLSTVVGLASCIASVVVAVHLQSKLHALGSPIHAWHVGAASAVGALLGPAVLLPPAAVWVYASRWQARSVGTPK